MSRVSRALAPGNDWPLALFTAMAIAGTGLLLGPFSSLAAGRALPSATPLASGGLLLLAAGLAVSLAHLGRPLRAPRAVRNVGRSRLSAEIVMALATLAAAAAQIARPSSPLATSVLAVSAAGFLVSLGLVYALPGQRAWRAPAAVTPLAMALPLAVLASAALEGGSASWRPTVMVLLCADLGLFSWRVRRLSSIPFGCRPTRPAAFRRRGLVLGLRFTLVTLAPLLLSLAGHPFPAAAALALGILVDRAGFYALAVRHTTEGEIEAVEDLTVS
jgi:hypothetical protein